MTLSNLFAFLLPKKAAKKPEESAFPARQRIGLSTSELLAIHTPYDSSFTPRKRDELKRNPYIYSALRNTREELVAKWYGAGEYKATSDLDENLERQAQILAASHLPIHEAQANHLRWNIDHRLKRSWQQVIRQLDRAREDGKSVLEIMWAWQTSGQYRGTWVIDDLIHCDPDCFTFEYVPQIDEATGTKTYVRQMLYDPNAGGAGTPVPPGKFICLSHDEDRERADGISILQCLAVYDWYQRNNFVFWMVHLNRYGSPAVVGKYPKGAGRKVIERLIATIRSFQQETGIVIPDDQQVEILSAQQRDGTGFEKLNDIIVKIISEVVTGNAMSMEMSQVGSFAATKATTAEIRTILLHARAVAIDGVVNRQLIPAFMHYNYPDTQEYPRQQMLPPRAEDIYNPASSTQSVVMEKTFQKKTPDADDLDALYARSMADGLQVFDRVWIQPALAKIEQANTPEEVKQAFLLSDEPDVTPYVEFLQRVFVSAYGVGLWRVQRQIEQAKRFEKEVDVSKSLSDAADLDTVKWILLNKPLMSKKDFEKLSDDMKRKAFTIAGQESAELQYYIREEIVAAVGQGMTLDEIRAYAMTAFDRYGITEQTNYHAATVFRTNLESAFADAQWIAIHDEKNLSEIAFLEYVTERDVRVRPKHRAMDGIIRPVNDPVWLIWWPPNGYNCRCRIRIITKKEADEKNIQPSPTLPWVQPDDGFANAPTNWIL